MVVLQEINVSSKMHNKWAVPSSTLPLPPPSICRHKEREKHCTVLMYTSLLPRVSRNTEQLIRLTDARCAHVLSQEHGPGERWLHPVAFSLGQMCYVVPIVALPYACLGLIIMFFPRNTLHCFSCLAASSTHGGSSLNECICASHKFLKEKVMQIFHFHSSRL